MWFSVIAAAQWYLEGERYYGHAGFARAKKNWQDPEMEAQRDLTGKQYIVTGANSGLGFAMAEELAKRKATVHMVCRDAERANDAQQKIVQQAVAAGVEHPDVQVHIADLGSVASVKAFATAFQQDHDVIHALINNAGALFNEEKRREDGVDMTMAIAIGGSFLLTGLLLPLLKRAEQGRVVNVSSGGQYMVGLDAKDVAGQSRSGANYDGSCAYSHAKRVQVELTKYWAQHPAAEGVIFHSMHPGWATTPGVTSSLTSFAESHGRMMRDPNQGADTAIWLAIADEPTHANGKFWFDREQVRTDMRFAGTSADDKDRAALWRQCEQLCDWQVPSAN